MLFRRPRSSISNRHEAYLRQFYNETASRWARAGPMMLPPAPYAAESATNLVTR